jgi:tRNA(Ile)-lysidine synthase
VVAAWTERHQLLRGVTHAGLAVSGGADSVALFHLLPPLCRERGIAVTVLHLNHGLRAEAEEEARFVQGLAAEAGLPCLCHCAGLAERPADGQSLEMAAREARLAFFQQCSRNAALDAIATGHQADDVAETLLLRLVRGAGAAGLSGLRPRSILPARECTHGDAKAAKDVSAPAESPGFENASSVTLIRPLLAVSGKAIRAWLTARGQSWREDASNRDTAIPRNLVRHTLLPQFEKAGLPDLRARLCQSAEILREDDAVLNEQAEQRFAAMMNAGDEPPGGLPLDALRQAPPALQRRILRLWLFRQRQPHAAGLSHVQTLLDRCREAGDWQVMLPGGAFARARGGRLAIHAAPDGLRGQAAGDSRPAECPVPAPTSRPVRWGGVEITAEFTLGIDSVSNGIGRYPAVCTLGAEAINGHPLTVRGRRPGDRIAPTGMAGTKKIQDLFVDAKLPEALRDSVPLVVCDGEIAWVPGYRVARRFAVPGSDAPSLRLAVSSE